MLLRSHDRSFIYIHGDYFRTYSVFQQINGYKSMVTTDICKDITLAYHIGHHLHTLRQHYLLFHSIFHVLVQIVFQLTAAARMTQFTECFGFNLTDTFTGNVKFLANFFKGSGSAVLKSEAKAKNALFPR